MRSTSAGPTAVPGGRDMTRLAGSSPEMWRDLLEHPPGTLVPSLRSLEILLKQIRESVEEGRVDELAELMDRTRAWWRG